MVKTIKLKLILNQDQSKALENICSQYKNVCNFVSDWVFNNDFLLNFMKLQAKIYHLLRENFILNSQMVISSLKTVTARYKALEEQLKQSPFKYEAPDGSWQYTSRTLEWLRKPIKFRKNQCDLVRNRNYRILSTGQISITILKGTIAVSFLAPPVWNKMLEEGGENGYSEID